MLSTPEFEDNLRFLFSEYNAYLKKNGYPILNFGVSGIPARTYEMFYGAEEIKPISDKELADFKKFLKKIKNFDDHI